MRIRLLSFLVCCWCGLLAWGTTKAESSSFFLTHLSNGLTVVVKERHSVPLVAIDLWMRAGAREERTGEDGTAHFLEHMLFRGTTDHPGENADVAAERYGASLNAETGPDALHIYTAVETTYFEPVLQILGDVAQHAALPNDAMDKERGVILDELAQRDADPTNYLLTLLYARTYPANCPYHHSPGGSPESIALRGRDTLMAFYRRCCTPERSILVLVGDITPDSALPVVQQVFGHWKSNALAQPLSALSQAPQWPSNQEQESDFRGDQWVAGIAFRAPRAANKMMVAAGFVCANLLEAVFAQQQPNADFHVHFSPRLDSSLYVCIFHATTQEALQRTQQALVHLLQQLGQTLPQELFLEARQRAIGQLDYQTETDEGCAEAIGEALITGGDPPDVLRQRLEALTPHDITALVQRYLNPQNSLLVVLKPMEASTNTAEEGMR